MVFRSEVGLDPLAVGGTTGVDVLSGFVASHEADCFDGRFVDDEVDCFGRSVNDVDHTGWEASFSSQLREDHGGSRVPL